MHDPVLIEECCQRFEKRYKVHGEHGHTHGEGVHHGIEAVLDLLKKKTAKVVCLCGSTKFKKEFEEANRRFTLEDHVVLTVGFFLHADGIPITEEQKERLDELHLRKIEMADLVFIINKDGYIGESTRREVAHAQELGKPLKYLEDKP